MKGIHVDNNWKIWDKDRWYGDIFFKRATGQLPEMESSKAIAKIISNLVSDNDLIVDVGCGGGHYLRSLDSKIKVNFRYWGIDPTQYYIEKANEAFRLQLNDNKRRTETKFSIGNVNHLEVEDSAADIVICNNVLQHLPAIDVPISELVRIGKKYIIIRMLVGTSSFRIKQIESPENYDEHGEPVNYHYYNIYSEDYIRRLLDREGGKVSYSFQEDKDYNPGALGTGENYIDKRPDDLTTTINGIQVNVYILEPWKFIIIKKQ
jgi:ubiquinone/menaquinone biosynthesis C-methylase UbiE